MNTPKGMVTDHKAHNTLDNRKCNLANATLSENQQNRKGARKGNKSGIRGVSWDERNQDWIVCVKGIYFGRFKDIDQARELANTNEYINIRIYRNYEGSLRLNRIRRNSWSYRNIEELAENMVYIYL